MEKSCVEILRDCINPVDLKIKNKVFPKVYINEIKERLGEHDVQLNQIYDALENLLDEKAKQLKWDDLKRH